MNPRRDPDRLIRAFLVEGEEQLQGQVYDAVRAAINQKRQRVVIGPWRMPTMNRFAAFGLAAAVVAALLVGTQLLGAPAPGSVGAAPSASASASPASPSPSLDGSLPEGPFVVTRLAGTARTITVTIPTSGWTSVAAFEALTKGDETDPPEAAILFWSWPAGTGFYVYRDPCQWRSTRPDTPATTVDEIAAALAAQASRNASDPVHVTVGGYAGKAITLHVPNDAGTRAEAFADCDDGQFVSYGAAGDDLSRYHQGPGQVDELWILDVDGAIVIIDAMYRRTTPTELIEEMRAIAKSATFSE